MGGRSGLPPRQARFVKEYLIDLIGTQAAIRAGYSPKTANAQSTRLLTEPDMIERGDVFQTAPDGPPTLISAFFAKTAEV